MPRRTYAPRSGRSRANNLGRDWSWLLELMRNERQQKRENRQR